MSNDGGEVRGIHAAKLDEWLAANIEGVAPPFGYELITGGHSNLTYRVTDSKGRRLVLRRPPLGAVLATAHDMAREHKIISCLGPTDVPVPPALGLCEDDTVNGAPFYIMSFVDGHVLANREAAEEHFPLEARRGIGESLVRSLAHLHQVDPDAVGLGKLGRKEAYLARQIKRWRKQWQSSKTRELAAMDEVADVLEQRMPEQIGASVVHGDFRLGNCLTGDDGQIAAVLDWELCTLGDPMADIGYLLNDWIEPGERPVSHSAQQGPSAAAGSLSRAEVVDLYESLTGRDLSAVAYYRAFQYWRLAAIVEGVLARYLKGVMGEDADTEGFRERVDALAAAAERMVDELPQP